MSFAWFDGVSLTVEAALSAATGSYGAWDSAVWDTSTWGPDILYQDISAYARGLTSTRTFSRDTQAWDTATSTVILSDRDRRFDPTNLSGPYVTAGVTGVRPWRSLRWSATYKGVTYPVYAGYAIAWEKTFVEAQADGYVTVPCQDEFGHLNSFGGVAVTPVGAGELAGPRVHRVLNNAGHTGARAVDVGLNMMQATDLSQNAATELKLVADSEGGAVYVDADGTVVFRQQTALLEDPRSTTIQATFGDGLGPGSEIPCADVTPSYNGDLTKNIVSFARVGGATQTVADATSRALYGDRRESRSDLVCSTDAQALTLAAYYLAQFKDPELLITKIQVKPRANPALMFPAVLGLKIRDLVRVNVRPIGGGTLTQDCHIIGISHTVTGADWITEFDLSSAQFTSPFLSSKWDQGVWDSALWYF